MLRWWSDECKRLFDKCREDRLEGSPVVNQLESSVVRSGRSRVDVQEEVKCGEED
jgi:hypothetical protein